MTARVLIHDFRLQGSSANSEAVKLNGQCGLTRRAALLVGAYLTRTGTWGRVPALKLTKVSHFRAAFHDRCNRSCRALELYETSNPSCTDETGLIC
jgi:hypothetical protein